MTDPLNLIQQIVDAEPFVLNDAVVVRLLDLLAEAVVAVSEDNVVVRVPELGTLYGETLGDQLLFRLVPQDDVDLH